MAAGARSLRALPRARSVVRAGLGAPGALPPGDRQVHRPRARTATSARRRRSTARSRSTRGSRSRTSSTPTSRPTSGSRSGRWCACSKQATRHGNDPELFAGLVQALPLLRALRRSRSRRTTEARRLDPNVPDQRRTDGDDDRRHRPAVGRSHRATPGDRDQGIRIIGLGLAGRRDAARQLLAEMTQTSSLATCHIWKIISPLARLPHR